jgi:hypothetical protein
MTMQEFIERIGAVNLVLFAWGTVAWVFVGLMLFFGGRHIELLHRDLRAWRHRALSPKATLLPPASPLPSRVQVPTHAQPPPLPLSHKLTRAYEKAEVYWAHVHSRRDPE